MIKKYSLKLPIIDFQQYNNLRDDEWVEIMNFYSQSINLQLLSQEFKAIERPVSCIIEVAHGGQNQLRRVQKGLNLYFIMAFMVVQHIQALSNEKNAYSPEFAHTEALVQGISLRFSPESEKEDEITVFIHSIDHSYEK